MKHRGLPVIVDLEASGFGRGSYPIEVGVALPAGELHAWLIKPFDHWTHWSDSAESVHSISRERLRREGLSARIIAQTLNNLLAGKTVYTDGWGVDSTWMALLFHECDIPQRFRLESIFSLLDESAMDAWMTTRERIIQERGWVPHRAGSDALIVQATYQALHVPAVDGQTSSRSA